MPRNKLSDLNNLLFEQLERMNDDELTEEEFKIEVERSRAVSSIAKNIIKNGQLILSAQKHVDEFGKNSNGVSPILLDTRKEKEDEY